MRRFWPGDVQGFIDGTIHEEIEGDCTVEDYLLMQLRLVSGLDIAEYERRGGRFTAAQWAFMRQCVSHGYATLDGNVFRLTPARDGGAERDIGGIDMKKGSTPTR